MGIVVGKSKILMVDDDSEIRQIVKVLLQDEGYETIEASCGDEALVMLDDSISLVILDVMMPDMDGYTVCKKIREKFVVPILFLTAKTKERDLVDGFSAGGDDYLEKPFSYVELVARVNGLIRRFLTYSKDGQSEELKYIYIKDIIIDKGFGVVTKKNHPVSLTNTEYQILLFLAETKGKIFSLKEIYEHVWEETFFPFSSNTVMVHIRNLREKIEDNANEPVYIKNAWGKGYYIE